MTYYAVHHGQLHEFETYKLYPKYNEAGSDWATYIAQNGCRYGISTALIASTREQANSSFIAKQTRMVARNLDEAKAATDRAQTWSDNLSRFSLSIQ